jgi:soluble lytic murein transglycosylase-like protein
MIDILCPKLDPVLKERIAECVGTTSEELHVPPEVIVAIAWKESRFKPMACSKKNAEGIMQVMLSAHGDKAKKYHITKDTIFHIDKNVFFGTLILKGYFLKTSSMKTALERYLGGRSESYVLDILNTATSLRMQLALLENENKPKTNGKGK